jgi:hypothetical protein
MQNALDGLGVLQRLHNLCIELARAIHFMGQEDFQLHAERLHGLQKRHEKMLSIARVEPTRAGNITQGFPHMRLIYFWIKKIVYPTQRVHGISNIVQPTLRPMIA